MGDKSVRDDLEKVLSNIEDYALPVGGALLGRKVARGLAGRTMKGRRLAAEVSGAEARAKGAAKGFNDEYDAAKKKLEDAARGKINLTDEEELHLRRIVSDYSQETPNSVTPALREARDADTAADEAYGRNFAYRAPRSAAGFVAGGAAGYAANKARKK